MKKQSAATPARDSEQETSWLSRLGPGVVTGAADDDPSGIATYSQAGARFGLNMLWTVLLTYPLMAAIQIISARIGRISGRGLASNMRLHYPRWILHATVLMLVAANTINIAADLAAMGDAVGLLVGGPARWYAVGFGLLSLGLQIFIPYHRYVRVLKWLTLALLAYVAVIFTIRIDWAQVGRAVVWPKASLAPNYITTVVAVLGTTISPYLFFWQASEEVEQMKSQPGGKSIRKEPGKARAELGRIGIDTYVGMGFSNLVAFFIMLTSALTLHAHGITSIDTSAQAAAGSAPDRRRLRVHAVCGRHRRHRPARGACARGFGCLCDGGQLQVGQQPGIPAGTGQGILRRDRIGDPGRHGHRFPAAGPGEGPVLERGHQWCDLGAHHGGDDAYGDQPSGDGQIRDTRRPEGVWLAGHGADGRHCSGNGDDGFVSRLAHWVRSESGTGLSGAICLAMANISASLPLRSGLACGPWVAATAMLILRSGSMPMDAL